jgi:hypothetical protein
MEIWAMHLTNDTVNDTQPEHQRCTEQRGYFGGRSERSAADAQVQRRVWCRKISTNMKVAHRVGNFEATKDHILKALQPYATRTVIHELKAATSASAR